MLALLLAATLACDPRVPAICAVEDQRCRALHKLHIELGRSIALAHVETDLELCEEEARLLDREPRPFCAERALDLLRAMNEWDVPLESEEEARDYQLIEAKTGWRIIPGRSRERLPFERVP